MIKSVDELDSKLQDQLYVSDTGLSTAVYLGLKLQRPLFLEGETGVGKTEVAKVLSKIFATNLIRLQCYEGLDVHHAIYEWNYPRQMLNIRLSERNHEKLEDEDLFGPEFLIKRPLLQAIDHNNKQPPVLLIDEIDRADSEFEAFLLELLSDFQITIPEIGTIKAKKKPIVVITSNRTREVHDALKRRCLYHWIDYPSYEKELAIITAKSPDLENKLSEQVVGFVQELRRKELFKVPGIAETLDWAETLQALNAKAVTSGFIKNTLGVLLKNREDIEEISGEKIQLILDQSKIQHVSP